MSANEGGGGGNTHCTESAKTPTDAEKGSEL